MALIGATTQFPRSVYALQFKLSQNCIPNVAVLALGGWYVYSAPTTPAEFFGHTCLGEGGVKL